MNWGYKILFVYAAFVVGISFLVVKSSSQKIDLVTTDYYAKELRYQQRIDETGRVNVLSEPVKYKIRDNSITVLFPQDFSDKKLRGEIVLYCPSNKDKDVKKDFSVQALSVAIPIGSFDKGYYILQVSWEADSLTYYFEEKILI